MKFTCNFQLSIFKYDFKFLLSPHFDFNFLSCRRYNFGMKHGLKEADKMTKRERKTVTKHLQTLTGQVTPIRVRHLAPLNPHTFSNTLQKENHRKNESFDWRYLNFACKQKCNLIEIRMHWQSLNFPSIWLNHFPDIPPQTANRKEQQNMKRKRRKKP